MCGNFIQVELVINHTIPNLPKNYIHRVGRTARAGRSGQAISFITPHEIKILLAIEAETRRKMNELKVSNKALLISWKVCHCLQNT